MILRHFKPEDEATWRDLWLGCLAFDDQSFAEDVTRATWRRLLDPAAPVFERVAEGKSSLFLGLCHCALHEGIWTTAPICYLEDLFVRPQSRGSWTGRALIEEVLALARAKGWSRLHQYKRSRNGPRAGCMTGLRLPMALCAIVYS